MLLWKALSLSFKILFIYSLETQRERETKAEGEAGSMQGAPCGTQSRDPGSPLSPPGPCRLCWAGLSLYHLGSEARAGLRRWDSSFFFFPFHERRGGCGRDPGEGLEKGGLLDGECHFVLWCWRPPFTCLSKLWEGGALSLWGSPDSFLQEPCGLLGALCVWTQNLQSWVLCTCFSAHVSLLFSPRYSASRTALRCC